MSRAFHTEELIDRARAAAGLERFDSESFREPLDILVAGLNRRTRDDAADDRTHTQFVNALSTRLRTTAYLEARPELLDRPIERPVFVFGIPRTGTTLLNNLLAADPARRSPLSWEIDEPVPPPTSATLTTDPRALAKLAAHEAMLAAHPSAGRYYRASPIYPYECMFFINQDFKCLMWESKDKLPEYRDYVYDHADLSSTYRYHKRFLQLLQADALGIWNLKMPSHALWLGTLLETYPDARLIWTHRDPLTATGSFCSILALGARYGGGEVDMAWIGENCAWQAVRHADRIMDTRDRLGEDRVIDVHYAELTRDPIGTMRRLYAALGDPFTPEAEAGMRAWLDDNPQNKFGRHDYRLDAYGLTPDGLRNRFERYLSRYDIESEG